MSPKQWWMIGLMIAYMVFLIAFAVYTYFVLDFQRKNGYAGGTNKILFYIYLSVAALIVVVTLIILIPRMYVLLSQ